MDITAVARLTGLEPATPGVTGRYSNQLSYNRAAAVAGVIGSPPRRVKREVDRNFQPPLTGPPETSTLARYRVGIRNRCGPDSGLLKSSA